MPISVVVPTVMPEMIVVVAVINPIPPTTRLGQGIGRQDCRAGARAARADRTSFIAHSYLLCLAIIRRGRCHPNNQWVSKFRKTVLNGF
jgi:hypothetical protein